jgi:disulfide oxidoreductase YuzD
MTVTSDQDTVFQNFVQEVIDADAFFSLVVIDDLVRAEGTYDGTSILADQLFLRECESSCL